MGTLGQYLRSAREAKEIDIRDAAQQTRISIAYLTALEAEDFSKLPGEVFVKGFLKNYTRFLKLDEAEVLKRYTELKPKPHASAVAQPGAVEDEKIMQAENESRRRETPIEPFIWGAVICISLLFFLFTSFPLKQGKPRQQDNSQIASITSAISATGQPASGMPEKLYLEIVALQDTWLLVRTDTSPQKKAVLKKGESLIWSADERFLVSYGRVGDVKLLLNGEELNVNGSRETAVRDLAITRTGVFNQPAPSKPLVSAKTKTVPQADVRQVRRPRPTPVAPAAAPMPVSGQNHSRNHTSDRNTSSPAASSESPSSAPSSAVAVPGETQHGSPSPDSAATPVPTQTPPAQ